MHANDVVRAVLTIDRAQGGFGEQSENDHQTKLFLCLALCSSLPACGGLLERVEQVRSAQRLIDGPLSAPVKVAPSTPDLTAEATHQAVSALRDNDSADARDAEHAAAEAE